MILNGSSGMASTEFDLGDFSFKQAFVNVAGIAFGTGHGDKRRAIQPLGGIAAADHRRNAQLTGDDGRVTGTPATVGNNGAGTLHHRFPIRVGHVGDQHIAGLHLVHLGDVVDDLDRAGADALADGAAFHQHGAFLLEQVALHDVDRWLRLFTVSGRA